MPEKLGAFASHQVSRSYTSGATRIRRTARRSLTDSPSLSRSTSKIASILTTSKGRDEGRFCAPGSDIGEHEELALTMQPAGGLHDRSLDDNLLHRAVKAGVGIGREDSRISAEMAFEVSRSGRANKYRSRGITAPRTSCNMDPQSTLACPLLGQHRHRCIVAVRAAAGEAVGTEHPYSAGPSKRSCACRCGQLSATPWTPAEAGFIASPARPPSDRRRSR
jgi:hypothetical protein